MEKIPPCAKSFVVVPLRLPSLRNLYSGPLSSLSLCLITAKWEQSISAHCFLVLVSRVHCVKQLAHHFKDQLLKRQINVLSVLLRREDMLSGDFFFLLLFFFLKNICAKVVNCFDWKYL